MTKQISLVVDYYDCQYDVEAIIEYHEEENYGADADGNRGGYRSFMDRIDVIEVREAGEIIETWAALIAAIECEIIDNFNDYIQIGD